ncbi:MULTISPECIES: type II secretion system F family protein [Moritella]|uniref:Type II/IV secretion system protein TadC,associated with Flp pilus assembly n=1 Tax=Moritella viscosa TaxID=80854 RepID=A0ABY1HC37_9GAMM|nr:MULTISPECIES: type II secretion system F family protein [Moritella]QUM81947.1 type II secretion system F family protein [Moritella sp. 5]CED58943.1 bacterial type II secretion system protein F [Moritella viscosa]SGY84474.1 Type II/IV secretion system protein TadC,associated with Flp pilus assembly [Moritella viscosa]SGY85376.1 Type II/IV secretion system protein TadC,associated with Flp pilus assembly [Moritella viscosa]SGY85475.1 Type II/IV secretion system protein TadC,associated with Flp
MLSSQNELFLLLILITSGAGLLGFYTFVLWKRRSKLSKLNFAKSGEGDVPYIKKAEVQIQKALNDRKKTTKNAFEAAGFYHISWAEHYLKIKYALLVIGLCGYYFLSLNQSIEMTQHVLFIAVWVLICVVIPDIYIDYRTKQLRNKIANKLPYLLDLMAVCIQTGMTIESSMRYLSKEMASFDRDISYFLDKTNDRSKIVSLEKALDELYELVPSNEMRSFVVTLKQSLRYGTSIYSILTTLAKDIRELQMLGMEEKIGKLAAKMSIPLILFIMVPIVILIAAPGIMRLTQSV